MSLMRIFVELMPWHTGLTEAQNGKYQQHVPDQRSLAEGESKGQKHLAQLML